MGNQVSTQFPHIKEEVGKRFDDARVRLQENVKTFKQYAESAQNGSTSRDSKNETVHDDRVINNNNVNVNNNNSSSSSSINYSGSGSFVPKIAISGSDTSKDLLDEQIIDKSIRGDVHLVNDICYESNYNGNKTFSYNNSPATYAYSNSSILKKDPSPNSNYMTNGFVMKCVNGYDDFMTGGQNNISQTKEILCADDICFTVVPQAKSVADYCVALLQVRFCGQTNSEASSDTSDTKDVLNLGLYLKLVDKFLHQFDEVSEFTGTEEEYLRLLKLVTLKRKQRDETTNQCFQRILADSHRFVEIYHKRGAASQRLDHKKFWGSRQQMLAGKVIADWIDPEGGPLDPIFGVILQPTAGRAGPGDSGWIHNILFDDMGHMAYHSAVHDAFGYLLVYHGIGPGYNYLNDSRIDGKNPLSGQLSGVSFWKEVIGEVEKRDKVLDCLEV